MSTSGKRFRIAFSFAGEKRTFVKHAATLLCDDFTREQILYDKFHEAEFARRDLGVYLPELYHKESDLIVVVACIDYDEKEWCGLEWAAIHDLLKQRKDTEVMLCRFERGEVRGLYGTVGWIELDDKTPEEFVELILERLAFNEGKGRTFYTQRALDRDTADRTRVADLHTSIPHNLPSLQPFFGREEELKKIADALDPESRGWGALIDGPGGMGKTSLAVRAAYDASPDDFHKIVFVSLKARELDDDGLRDLSGFILSGLAELFGEVARLLGRDDLLKADETQRPRLLLDALRDTRTLLLLDNLESLTKPERDTVFTFVNKLPAGCKAILTARGRIGSGAQELILEKLSERAALDTLADLATRHPLLAQTSEAERLVLYRETGGKPLLLRWTAGQLGRGHCLTFTDALHFIRSCPEGNDPLEFIFGDLVDDFSEDETKVLSALSYFTLPAKVEHLAPLAELPEPETDRALRRLVNRSLAVPSEELNTFVLVPMVADFLRKKTPEIVAETGDRLEKRAYVLILENGNKNFDRFPALEAAWWGVAPALPLFLAGDNARLQVVCDALSNFLNFTGRWDEWLALLRLAESSAMAANDFYRAGWRAYQVGSVYYQRGRDIEVIACADRVDSHWRATEVSTREHAATSHMRGLGYKLAKNYPAATVALKRAVEFWRALAPNGEDVAVGLNDLANVERLSGDYNAAERNYREGLRIARAVDDLEGVAIYTGNLVDVALDRGDWIGAETIAREALSLSTEVGRLELVAEDCRRLALTLGEQGRAQDALPYAQQAVEIYQRLGSPDLELAHKTLRECEEALE
jgi:tetratricopeptide (TPR) repeat protein